MPIRPEMKDRYPKDWPEISRRIRFERAGGRCECRGECGNAHYQVRCRAKHGEPHPVTESKVVLTVAHLDPAPENCADDNLLAMCQRCHLALDRLHHVVTGRENRDRKIGQGALFDERALIEEQPLIAANSKIDRCEPIAPIHGGQMDMSRAAIFSRCKTWRYRLVRTWNTAGLKAVWVMLNPSKANGERDDPTTTQNVRRMEALGYGRYEAVNAFAAVDTDPKALKSMLDPIGPGNDQAILAAIADADIIVVAWGRGAALHDRAGEMLELLRGHDLWCLGVNTDGTPRFPRAVRSDQPLIRYHPPKGLNDDHANHRPDSALPAQRPRRRGDQSAA